MVKIVYPNTTVCYESSPMFTCTFEEATDSASWNMIQVNQLTALSNGNVVQLNNSCTNAKYKSCTVLTLQKVTSAWAGKYRDVARMIFCLNKKKQRKRKIVYHLSYSACHDQTCEPALAVPSNIWLLRQNTCSSQQWCSFVCHSVNIVRLFYK